MIVVEVYSPNEYNVEDVYNVVEVDVESVYYTGSAVADHGGLAGLADDDHLQYQRADSVTVSADFIIDKESIVLVVDDNVTVTLPPLVINDGRTITVVSGNTGTVVDTTGTDTISVVASTASVPINNVRSFTSTDVAGTPTWLITNANGNATDIPAWIGQSITAGHVIKMGATAPEWGAVTAVAAAHASTHSDGGTDEIAIDASQTTSGVFNVARLGTGTSDAYHFLDGSGTWNDNVPVLIPCKNTSGGSLAKGTAVYITGTVGATPVVEIAAADSDDVTKMPALGLLADTIGVNATGYVVTQGIISGVDTSTYTINAPLYVSTTAGQLTTTRPSTGIQPIARAGRINASNGELIVVGTGSTQNTVAIDPIFDAAGDLAVGSGADTAAKLTKGNQTQALVVGASTLEWGTNHFSGANFVTGTVANTIAETLPGATPFAAVAAPGLSGVAHLHGVYLPKGTVVTNLSVVSGAQAAVTPTNQWFALCNDSRQVLRYSVNDTTAAWAASTPKTLALTSTFTTTYSGLHYIAVVVTATTMPSFRGLNIGTLTGVTGQSFLSSTGLTTPAAFGAEGTAFAAATSRINIVMGIVS